MATSEATVQTLTAEVRVLMVGNRQVTLSVFRQLDHVDYDTIDIFGRVNDGDANLVIGRCKKTGALVRSEWFSWLPQWGSHHQRQFDILSEKRRIGHVLSAMEQEALHSLVDLWNNREQLRSDWQSAKAKFNALPLIVLAGLK